MLNNFRVIQDFLSRVNSVMFKYKNTIDEVILWQIIGLFFKYSD